MRNNRFYDNLQDDKSEPTAWTNLCAKYMQDPKRTLADLFR